MCKNQQAMTNIKKIITQKDVQSHIHDKAFAFIEEYLPEYYAAEAQKRLNLSNINVDIESIQAIKNKRGKKNPSFLKVLSVLVEIAEENKLLLEHIGKKIDN